MTDTETVTKRTQAPRDVDYTLEVLDGDLPEMEVTRKSQLEDQLEKVVANADFHGKWVRIGSYANGSAGTAAANVLRKRHGKDKTIEGWTFKPKRMDDDRTGLWVKYEPAAVIAGAKEQWEADVKAKKAAANEPAATSQTPRESAGGPGQTSGTADAAKAKAPANKQG